MSVLAARVSAPIFPHMSGEFYFPARTEFPQASVQMHSWFGGFGPPVDTKGV